MSRQNYYARRKARQRRQVDGELVAQLVVAERRRQPRLGTRKLYHRLKPELERAGVKLGRDRLFEELGQRDLLVRPFAGPIPAYDPVLPQPAGVWESGQGGGAHGAQPGVGE